MKYKYLFRFGRGKRTLDLLGPSVDYFWNEIYDVFDLTGELRVKKLDRTEFTDKEIKKLARDFFEDVDEDCYVVRIEIRNKELYFCSLGTFGCASGFDGYLKANSILSKDQRTVDIFPGSKELFFHTIDGTSVGVLMVEYTREEETISESLIEKFNEDCDENKVSERFIVTDNEIENAVKKLANSMNIKMKSTDQVRREINEILLNMALDARKDEFRSKKGAQFTYGRFNVFFEYVKNARTNLEKKRSLEDLAEYVLNSVSGLEVISKNPRGPSEEIDLIVANESKNELFRRFGSLLLVECRHRRKPATSSDIRDFSGKMRSLSIKTGILFSLKGITGNKYDAQSALRDAKKDGRNIIVLNMNDLREISEGIDPTTTIRNAFYRVL